MEVVVKSEAVTMPAPSNHHHQRTNTSLCTGWMPFLLPNSPTNSVKALISHSTD